MTEHQDEAPMPWIVAAGCWLGLAFVVVIAVICISVAKFWGWLCELPRQLRGGER